MNVGSENPRIEPVTTVRSTRLPGFDPAQSPSGTPTATASAMATPASSSVAGSRSRITPSAGSRK